MARSGSSRGFPCQIPARSCTCAACGTMSGGEAASFWLSVPRSGLVPVTASTRRIGAEQGLAIIAAEQEDEPVQVLP
jgi:hypothetical protein